MLRQAEEKEDDSRKRITKGANREGGDAPKETDLYMGEPKKRCK